MTVSLYSYYGDYKTASDITRWIFDQTHEHPQYDTLVDAIFMTKASLDLDRLFHKRFGSEKFSVTVDVTADNGQKQQFHIYENNMHLIQKLHFALPVRQITYTVSGFGLAHVWIKQSFVEKEQKLDEPTPFQVSQEFKPMSWLNEIAAKTCMSYTPTKKDLQLVKENFNRTVVVEVELPSGMRINLRQLGFMLSRAQQHVLYFKYPITD